MRNSEPDIVGLLIAAKALPAVQRAALANELVLGIDDTHCRLAVSLIARNAVTVSEALDRAAFLERDARRAVVS